MLAGLKCNSERTILIGPGPGFANRRLGETSAVHKLNRSKTNSAASPTPEMHCHPGLAQTQRVCHKWCPRSVANNEWRPFGTAAGDHERGPSPTRSPEGISKLYGASVILAQFIASCVIRKTGYHTPPIRVLLGPDGKTDCLAVLHLEA